MSYDNRKALPEGHDLTVTDGRTHNQYHVTIQKEMGRGGSCIVYSASQKDWVGNEPVERAVIVKELYPKALDSVISRTDKMDLAVPDTARKRYEEYLESFCAGQAEHIIYANDNAGSALPPVSFSGTAHDTFYAVSARGQGTVLSELDRSQLSLTDALRMTASICDAIHAIHANGMKLYLDCKPDNIYVFNGRAYLFDFDTVQWKGRLRYCSYSYGWSAPEQVYDGEGGYADPQKIGFHTDIFSIGAVLFYLLVGRKPTSEDLVQLRNGFDWPGNITLWEGREALGDAVFIRELSRVMQSILEPDPDIRKVDFGSKDAAVKAGNEIDHLAALSENAPYRKGFEDTNAAIREAKDHLEETIERHSVRSFLFGTKKRVIAAVCIFAAIAAPFGVIAALSGGVAGKMAGIDTLQYGSDMDAHILLKLSNANHQYEVGLENWRRLDYIRADRDIHAARDEISGQKAQSELDVARINNSLGCLYIDMGKYREAYDYLNSAYVTFRDTLGPDSVETRAVRASMSQYYYNTGMLDEALAETQYILDNSDADSEQAIIASTSHLRAMILDAQGRYDEALALLERVLEMYRAISENGKLSEQLSSYANDPQLSQTEKDYYTDSIRWIILTYNDIAEVNIHKGNYPAAEEAANIGIGMSLSNIYIGKRNLTTSRLYMNLAVAQGGGGDTETALENIDLAMRIQRNLFDFADVFPGLVRVYDAYGDLLMIEGEREEAEDYYSKAVHLARDSFGENHPLTAAALDAMGNFCGANDEEAAALRYLLEAIEIRRNILAEDHPDTARIYYDLAVVQSAMGSPDEARDSLAAAKAICDDWHVEGALRDKIDDALAERAA